MCVYPGVFMSVCIYVFVLCLHVVDRGLIWLSFSTALWLFSKTFLWKWVFCLHVCMCINCVQVSAKVRRSYWIPGSGVTNAGERTLFPGNWVWVFSAAAALPKSHLSSCSLLYILRELLPNLESSQFQLTWLASMLLESSWLPGPGCMGLQAVSPPVSWGWESGLHAHVPSTSLNEPPAV